MFKVETVKETAKETAKETPQGLRPEGKSGLPTSVEWMSYTDFEKQALAKRLSKSEGRHISPKEVEARITGTPYVAEDDPDRKVGYTWFRDFKAWYLTPKKKYAYVPTSAQWNALSRDEQSFTAAYGAYSVEDVQVFIDTKELMGDTRLAPEDAVLTFKKATSFEWD